jgi:hypothetical protein
VLALHLPAGAQVWKAVGTDRSWTEGEHLQAFLIDVAQMANWQRGQDKSAAKPRPFPRPGDQIRAARKREGIAAKGRAFEARQRAKQTTEEA